MSLTDTHAHLDYSDYDADRDAILKRAQEAGVDQVISIGIGKDSISKTLELCQRYANVYAVVGVHPTDLDALPEAEWSFLEQAAGKARVVAIGETGLDYYRLTEENKASEQAKQKKYFVKQLELAKKVDKPVVIHCREAYADTLEILKQFGRFRKEPGVMHCFGADWDTAQQVFELGLMISVGGILTFKNAESLREIVQRMPREKLLLETDCPFLAPVPHRGKRNEPAYTRLVAEKVAELWQMSLQNALEQISANVRKVFRI
jgi:TatD DNase family protein